MREQKPQNNPNNTIVTEKQVKIKNQHFVPRMYLKNFAVFDGKAINLYNLHSGKSIKNAPTKGQCSRDYFYGEDLVIEKSLQPLEGRASTIIKEIIKTNHTPFQEQDKADLLLFTIFLLNRTLSAANAIDAIADNVGRTILKQDASLDHELLNEVSIGLTNPAAEALRAASQSVFMAADLAMKLLINHTDTELITSDNPVILYNQLLEGSDIKLGSNTGLAISGLQVFLPLSPRHLLVFYDRAAYKVGDKKSDSAPIKNKDDVRKFNDLQYLNCHEHLYAYSGFGGTELDLLIKRNSKRTRLSKPSFETWNEVQPDGATRVNLRVSRHDHRIKLSVEPIRQIAKLNAAQPSTLPKPIRDAQRLRVFQEFREAVRRQLYGPHEIKRFIADRISATSKTSEISPLYIGQAPIFRGF